MQQEERCGHSRQSAFLSKSTASGVCGFLQISDTCQFWPSQRSTVNSQCLFTFTVCRPRQCLRTLLVNTHSLSPQAVSKQIACSHPQSVVQTGSTYIPCSHPQSVALDSVYIHCLFTPTVSRPRQCQHTFLVHTHSLSPQAVSKQISCSHPQSVVQTVSTYIPCSHPQSVALECLHTCLFTTTVCRPRQCLHTLFVHTHNLSPQTVSTYSVC